MISQNPVEPIKAPDGPQIARYLFVANHNKAAVGTAKKQQLTGP
jgi:hypothetical protein